MKFTILGRPVTKKNHTRRVWAKGRQLTIQSAAHEAWVGYAILQINRQRAAVRHKTLTCDVHLRAVFFRKTRTGDLNNFVSALADALQAAGVVANDRQIVSLDGCRLDHDPKNPRIELEVIPMARTEAT